MSRKLVIVVAIHKPPSRLLRRALCHSGIFTLSQIRCSSVVQVFMVGRRRGERSEGGQLPPRCYTVVRQIKTNIEQNYLAEKHAWAAAGSLFNTTTRMSKHEDEFAERFGVMGLADGKSFPLIRWVSSHPALVAEALHEIADRLSERGLQAGRRANRVEPRDGYSAESDARYARF